MKFLWDILVSRNKNIFCHKGKQPFYSILHLMIEPLSKAWTLQLIKGSK